MSARYIVAIGNPVEGLTFYGPFPDHDSASEYTETECGDCDWWIAPLTAPED